ncbi:MAG: hypothetical protein ACK448_05975 [Bacteroidota bacterium]|jgi:hypothetical protein
MTSKLLNRKRTNISFDDTIIRILLVLLFFITSNFSIAKNPPNPYWFDVENQLIQVSPQIIAGETDSAKFEAAEWVFAKLQEELIKPESFSFSFDLLRHTTVAIASHPNSRVRIFSFNVIQKNGVFVHYGIVQRKGKKENKIWALKDTTSALPANFQEQTIENPQWIGALYYQLIPISKPYKDHYIVIGFDGNNKNSNRSYLDVLWFEEGEPRWGKPLFRESIEDPSAENRWIWEYHKSVKMVLRYETEKNLIVMDELGPSYPQAKGNYFLYIPTGDYSAFIPNKAGYWVLQPIDLTDFGQGEAPNIIKERPLPTEPPVSQENILKPDPNSPDGG